MVVHRRPGELQAELPAAVYAVDLDKLSDLLGIREDELVCGIHSKRAVSEIHGVVVDIGEDVPFESVGNIEEHKRLIPSFGEKTLTHPRVSRKGVKQVLLTAAARPGTLDSDDLPKCLIQLGSQPIIGHILTQLYASGIERVVISVAAGGEKIIQAVKQSRFYSKMNIEFLDLGPNNRDGHARSILAARNYFPKGPFLIHTSDHIFDKSIISKLLNYQLNENVACVLVETDISGLVGLPSTSVRVQLGREYVRRISRDLVQYDGIDAGLFLSSTAIFDALNDLAAKKEYFSLADALSYFTKFNKLTYVPTSGETWFSIETKEQLAYTKDQDGSAILSPWTVFLACAPEIPPGPSLTTKSMVIGVTAAETDTSLRVARQQDDTVMFDGFIVGVNNGDSMNEASISENDMQIEVIDDSTPLLSKRSVETGAGIMSSGKSLLKNPSFIDRSEINESFILSFPMDEEISRTIDSISATHRAFLIEMAPEPSTPVSSNSHFMLAVSGKEALDATPKKELGLLPSDIQSIALETRGCDENIEVTVFVERKAPLIGYLLLLTSIITISSVGVALDMEHHSPPLLKLFWRNSATSMACIPLAIMSIRKNGRSPLTYNVLFSMLFAGMSYAFYLGTFVISLNYTSVGHATLFSNAHSLLIVLIKLVVGPNVALFEGLGAAVGVVGGAITTMDGTTAVSADIVSPSLYGDLLALVGALGGASYFLNAKKLRPKVDIFVFICCLTAISAMCLLSSMLLLGIRPTFSTDPHIGLFGWLTPARDRLPVELYLVFVCDLIGTLGYISVMKYFDPIVVSIACLTEPIVATIMGIFMGVDAIPGILTFLGSLLVILGTFLVISTQSQRTEMIDATKSVRSSISATPKPMYSARIRKRSLTYGSTVH